MFILMTITELLKWALCNHQALALLKNKLYTNSSFIVEWELL